MPDKVTIYQHRIDCGHCGNKTAFEIKGRYTLNEEDGGPEKRKTWLLLQCLTCFYPTLARELIIFYDDEDDEKDEFELGIVYPITPTDIPKPSKDMPKVIIKEYNEARTILPYSPRASAALLRLALQKLCIHLGQSGKDLNKDIGALIKAGLSPEVQKALDSVRVIGNNAVHPGKIDLNDNPETASTLFRLINFIIHEMISRPREIEVIYNQLPQTQRDEIQKRDSVP